ncbi:hypothetical protein QBC38DRAFT_372233 [Podospora fimiseda]|uniref:F-box domain-containing protein n=1 Tax=Podospora fimiseda TaxID=252190 RepID=A0AAN7BIA2_9PEZI|nr:hypothetical protein QBC38DRAFT_372233 [Podospora fimiseda]
MSLTASIPSPPAPTFLTLPLELRHEIYSHILTLPPLPPPSPVYRSPPSPPRSPSPSLPKHYTAILLACRQTHHEATPLLYTLNTFKADPDLLTAVPSPLINDKYIPLIRNWSIKIRLDPPPHSHPEWSSTHLTRAFNNSHSLTITLWQASFMGGVGISQLSQFESVRGVRSVKIQGMMPGYGRYVKWLEKQMMKPVGKDVEQDYEPEDEWEERRLGGWS